MSCGPVLVANTARLQPPASPVSEPQPPVTTPARCLRFSHEPSNLKAVKQGETRASPGSSATWSPQTTLSPGSAPRLGGAGRSPRVNPSCPQRRGQRRGSGRTPVPAEHGLELSAAHPAATAQRPPTHPPFPQEISFPSRKALSLKWKRFWGCQF